MVPIKLCKVHVFNRRNSAGHSVTKMLIFVTCNERSRHRFWRSALLVLLKNVDYIISYEYRWYWTQCWTVSVWHQRMLSCRCQQSSSLWPLFILTALESVLFYWHPILYNRRHKHIQLRTAVECYATEWKLLNKKSADSSAVIIKSTSQQSIDTTHLPARVFVSLNKRLWFTVVIGASQSGRWSASRLIQTELMHRAGGKLPTDKHQIRTHHKHRMISSTAGVVSQAS